MKTKALLSLVAGFGLLANAAPLTESTFTEIIQNVDVVDAATKSAKQAQAQLLVKAPDMIRTGPQSRAELTAGDQTITRIGANSVFSFDQTGRNVRLERGSVLFHSPHGKGGGTITSGGASAAVLGTTLICVALPDGSFKSIVLEGKVTVTLASGKSVTLGDGQMVVVLPGGKAFSEVMDVDLKKLVNESLLISGFSNPLPSLPLIIEAMQQQEQKSAEGDGQNVSLSEAQGKLDAIGYDTIKLFRPGLLRPPGPPTRVTVLDSGGVQGAVGGVSSGVLPPTP